jgi:hypothetical protein
MLTIDPVSLQTISDLKAGLARIRRRRASQVLVDRALRQPSRRRDRPVGQTASLMQPQCDPFAALYGVGMVPGG